MRLLTSLFAPLRTRPTALLLLPALLFAAPLPAQSAATTPQGRVVLVLPFTNRSGDASLNWIGDSFPDTLDKRLNSAGFLTISHDDRTFAYDHLGLPADFRPSRATTIRIAQQLDADFVIIGTYNITPATPTTNPAGTSAAVGTTNPVGTTSAPPAANTRISIQAQVLSVDNLTLASPVEDSAELSRLFDAENAIAWKVARSLDPHFNVAEPTFLAAPGAVPLPAFEDYIRGTNATLPADRLKHLQAAVALAPAYPAALLALGKQQFADRDFTAAALTLAKVPATDRLALEANFYLGLARFNTASYTAAASAFAFVATRLPLPEVINNQAVALSRQGAQQTTQAVVLFQRASAADPSDEDYHYNLAVALFRNGDTPAALTQIDTALKLKPSDNEAIALRKQLTTVPAGTRLATITTDAFTPLERIRRTYSETSFRQAAFQLDQLRAARLAMLPPDQRADQYTLLGRDYLAEGLLPEAENQFQAALAADPRQADAHAGLAQIRSASGDTGQARAEAKASLALHPSAAAWLVLANLDLAANQFLNCAEDVTHAQQIEPNNAAAQALRLALEQRGQWVPTP